jgi:hypothetical protein
MAAAPIPVDENGNPIATGAPVRGGAAPIPVDENGNEIPSAGPTLAERFGFRPATRQEAIVGRGAAEGVLSPIDLAAHIVQSSRNIPFSPLDLIASETGQQPTEEQEAATSQPQGLGEFVPSQQLLDFIGLKAPKNMTPGEQTEASLIPYVTPTPATAARVVEAAGPLTKGVTAATSAAGGVVDWALSGAMQEYAQAHGWGPVATEIASILATQARHAPGHAVTVAETAKKLRGDDTPLLGNEEAGQIYDDNRAIGVTPPIEDVAGEKLRSTASAINAKSYAPSTGSSAAKDLQTKGIVNAADEGIRAIDPSAPSIAKGTPGTLNDYSEMLSTRARNQIDANRVLAKAESDRLEDPIKTAPIDAAPTQAALTAIIIDKDNYGVDSRKTAQGLLDRFNEDVDPTTGTISFAAMKQQRENFNNVADQLFPVQTGVPTTSRSIGHDISPVEKTMTDGLVKVAGPEWAANDAKWSQNARELQSLKPITGVLKRGDWKSPPGSSKVAKSLKGAVEGNMPVLDSLEKGMPGESRSAVAQVLAAQGTPQGGTGSGSFRPDLFATQYPKEFGKGARARVAQEVGPEAVQSLDKAAAAAKGTVRPRKPGGLEEELGALGRVGAFAHDVGGLGVAPAVAGFMGGPVGLAGAVAARALLPRLLNDPSFVRLVAGRRFTADNLAGVLAQYAQRAGLAATGPKASIGDAGRSATHWAQAHLPGWSDVPGFDRLLGGGQR